MVLAAHRLTAVAFDRAIHGRRKGIWKDGEEVGEEYVPSDRLLMFLLAHFDPMRYGKLSGIIPFNVRNPLETAAEELPICLDEIADQPRRADEDQHEWFGPIQRLRAAAARAAAEDASEPTRARTRRGATFQ
ncbi:hypothetical protein Q4F19_00740 [Sphingomonas sp. BIUV-7]|uniref:Uncharacterized protein n=1 Tax=Sphingomonas natans TaxID=3063330 RepID=A0ABT8Y3L0_9SPHN|nr:hypothetical protein [Sphingomonas sp. BIUV-7]MDO6412898.1 hypothetical protein [Sphingomonas sp. BIUV-7]